MLGALLFLPCFFIFYFFDSHHDIVQEGFAECPGPINSAPSNAHRVCVLFKIIASIGQTEAKAVDDALSCLKNTS